jgi:hypothetical protein
MRWRRVTHRLPLTGVAVAGAVIGHMAAYVLAVPSPTVHPAPWSSADATVDLGGVRSRAATFTTEEFL